MGATISDLAAIRLLLKKDPNAGPKQVRALLCIMKHKTSYFSLKEIEQSQHIKNGELKKIMQSFSKKQLVQKEGCLFKKIECEALAEII